MNTKFHSPWNSDRKQQKKNGLRQFEQLEDRTVPAGIAYTWNDPTNTTGTFSYSAGPWKDSQGKSGLPGPGDTVTAGPGTGVTILIDTNVTINSLATFNGTKVIVKAGKTLTVAAGASSLDAATVEAGGTIALVGAGTSLTFLPGQLMDDIAGTLTSVTNTTFTFGAPLQFNPGASLTGAGKFISLSGGGDVTFNTSLTLPNDFSLDNGSAGATTTIAAGATVTAGSHISINNTERLKVLGDFIVPNGSIIDMIHGQFSGDASTTPRIHFNAGSTLNIDDGSFQQVAIENAGQINWNGNDPNLDGGAQTTINNLAGGVFNITNDQNFSSNGVTFNNFGLVKKSSVSGTGTSSIGAVFNNRPGGSIQVDSGKLLLFGGGDFQSTMTVGANAVLQLAANSSTPDVNMVATATFAGAGLLEFPQGNVNILGNSSFPRLLVSGGMVRGSGTLTVTGQLDYTSGLFQDATGTVVIPVGVNFNIITVGSKTIDKRTFNISGAMNVGSGVTLAFGIPTPINILPGGVLDLQDGSTLQNNANISNQGTIRKSTGAGTASVAFTNITNIGGALQASSGILAIQSAIVQNTGSIFVAAGAELDGGGITLAGGTLSGSGLVKSNVTNNNGNVSPGSSAGTLTIQGNYTQGALGTLAIEIGGTTVTSQYDRLAITGTATLNGALALSTINGFAPAVGNTFDVMTYASKTGDFTSMTGINPGGNVQYTKTAGATAVTIGVVPSLPNAAPVNTVPAGPIATPVNTAKVITGISIADADAASTTINVTIGVGHGTLTVNTAVGGGLTAGQVSGNGTASVVLSGTLSQINATLANATGLTYTPTNAFNGTDVLTVLTNDLGNTGTGGTKTDVDSVSINVGEVSGTGSPVNGTAGNDIVVVKRSGSSTTQVIVTLNGTDLGPYSPTSAAPLVINGLAGNDNIQVNSDVLVPIVINGGDDQDTIAGGQGNDTIDGGLGNDLVFGGLGDDILLGNDGADSMDGMTGNDSIDGGSGPDLLFGSAGNDILFGQIGNDALDGGDGNDGIDGGLDNDYIAGGTGADYIVGNAGNDSIDAGDGNDSIDGGDGNDVIFGVGGDDVAYGGAGDDSMDLGIGNDTADAGAGNDLMFGSSGNDFLIGGLGNDSMDGDDGDDTLDGGANDDLMFGSTGNDLMFGNAGNDAMDGGPGTDTADGGAGTNSIFNVP